MSGRQTFVAMMKLVPSPTTSPSARRWVEEALRASNRELAQFNQAMVGRELRMIELKKEIDELCKPFGRPPRYGRSEKER